jgi:hypothetical protein
VPRLCSTKTRRNKKSADACWHQGRSFHAYWTVVGVHWRWCSFVGVRTPTKECQRKCRFHQRSFVGVRTAMNVDDRTPTTNICRRQGKAGQRALFLHRPQDGACCLAGGETTAPRFLAARRATMSSNKTKRRLQDLFPIFHRGSSRHRRSSFSKMTCRRCNTALSSLRLVDGNNDNSTK